jgi:hypothetical protein
MKIRLVGGKLFHADGWTDRRADIRMLIIGFRNFANVPKSVSLGAKYGEELQNFPRNRKGLRAVPEKKEKLKRQLPSQCFCKGKRTQKILKHCV